MLPDGRVVTDADGRVRVWDPTPLGPARSSSSATAAGWGRWRCYPTGGWSPAATTGGCWCRTRPPPGPARWRLGRHDSPVSAVAVLPDGRVVTGDNDRRVLVRDVTTRSEVTQVRCSVTALATGPLDTDSSCLVIVHQDAGFSVWSVTDQRRG